MLREHVLIQYGWGKLRLKGKLFVGADGLPELEVTSGLSPWRQKLFSVSTLPATWVLVTDRVFPGVLLNAWREIEKLRQEIADAQREAEMETRREPDDIDAYKREAEVRGER